MCHMSNNENLLHCYIVMCRICHGNKLCIGNYKQSFIISIIIIVIISDYRSKSCMYILYYIIMHVSCVYATACVIG